MARHSDSRCANVFNLSVKDLLAKFKEGALGHGGCYQCLA